VKESGFEVVFDGLYSQGTLDFANQLTQIKAGNPDWLYATGYIQELVVIRRQMANLGMNVPIVTMTAGASYPEFGQNLGPLANNVSNQCLVASERHYKDDYIFGGAPAYTKQFMDSTRKSRHISKQRPRLAARCWRWRSRRPAPRMPKL